MKMEESTSYVKKCFNGEPASCSYACPFSLDIRSFMEKLEKGRWLPAYKALRNATVFPVIVSTLCPQPCRNHCQRSSLGDEALAVSALEAACIKLTKSRQPENFIIPPKSQRIAVVGAGAAGLSCALNLAQKKFLVTVFEKDTGWGGSLRTDPHFKEFDEDIALQFSAVNVDFRFCTEIDSLDKLNDFDAIYIATGAGGLSFGLLDNWFRDLATTSNSKVFMGGGVCGLPLMESIAQGTAVSKTIEMFLSTGKTSKTFGDTDTSKCNRYLRHDGAAKMPLIHPASDDGYTEEEAKAEASRCFKCDCEYCENSCEMLKWFRKKPPKIGIEVYTDSIANPPMSTRTIMRETNSCNICGHCKSVCPESVDIGALLQFSRTDRTSSGKNIPALHDYWLREMDFHTNEAYFASAAQGKEICDYAFFPGCQLGAANSDYVIKSYDYLSEKFDTGIILGCCGAPAYWAGDQARLDTNIARLRASWINIGKPTLIYACAYCENVFSLYLPEIKRVSLYELLAQDAALKPTSIFSEAAIFDPCAARNDDAMQKGVRMLAEKAGVTISELKEPNRCCGYGGHMRLANPELYDEITDHRAAASDQPYIVYCANCREVFKQKDKACVHILDMAYGLDPQKHLPSLHSKRENSLEVKKHMMKIISGKNFTPEAHEWAHLNLIIGDELSEDLDRKLIVENDLKEAIWRAEQTGETFYDETDGMSQCSMVKTVLTYWVQFKKLTPDTFEIYSAYSHRMKFMRED